MEKKRINCICFSVTELDKLEYIPDGNKLPNYKHFIENVLPKESVAQLYELWSFTNELIGNNKSRESFDHQLGTILISCKIWKQSHSHGSKYGSLTVTTYQNNSIPNLYEISVSWPLYSTNPIDFKEQIK